MTPLFLLFLLLLAVHLLVSAVCFVLAARRGQKPGLAAAWLVLLVPPAGFLAFAAAWAKARGGQDAAGQAIGLDPLKINNEMYQNIFYTRDQHGKLTVPVEEAMVLNDPASKRTLMMDILSEGPQQYIELLQTARHDTDTEVSHYATTAMVELHKGFELRLQQCEQACLADATDLEALDRYRDALREYLDSGLAEGSLLAMYRNAYLQTLQRCSDLQGEPVGILRELFRVQVQLQNYSAAAETVALTLQKWPALADGYLMQLQLCAALHDGAGIQRTLGQLRAGGLYIPERDRQTVAFWAKPEAARQGRPGPNAAPCAAKSE